MAQVSYTNANQRCQPGTTCIGPPRIETVRSDQGRAQSDKCPECLSLVYVGATRIGRLQRDDSDSNCEVDSLRMESFYTGREKGKGRHPPSKKTPPFFAFIISKLNPSLSHCRNSRISKFKTRIAIIKNTKPSMASIPLQSPGQDGPHNGEDLPPMLLLLHHQHYPLQAQEQVASPYSSTREERLQRTGSGLVCCMLIRRIL